MFLQTIPEKLKSNLELLGGEPACSQFYLAGGTALALQLGHRISNDLDFFTQSDFSEKNIRSVLESCGELEVEVMQKKTLLGKLNKVKISFFFYQYPLLFPPVPFLGINLADIRDIGAMKFDAIQSRGTKRDFIDLFALLHSGVLLTQLILYFEKKYAGANYNKTHLLKSLSYFVDAEKEEMPQMLKPITWKEVKKYIESEVKKFLLTQVG